MAYVKWHDPWTNNDLVSTQALDHIESGIQNAASAAGAPPVASKTSAYTATDDDYFLLVTGTTTITLPTAVGRPGKVYVVKKTDAAGTNVTLATTSSQTIDGSTTRLITLQYAVIRVFSNGTNWSAW